MRRSPGRWRGRIFYPWPQRPAGLIDEAFAELARRWLPILNAFDEAGVDACFELHPGEDLHDGATFERFLAAVDNHPRANILLTRATWFCSSSTISDSSICIMSACARST